MLEQLRPSLFWSSEPLKSWSDPWQNGFAWVVSLIIVQVWLGLIKVLISSRILGSSAARKMIHIGTGPLFILCWNIFPVSPYAKYWASSIPLGMLAKFGAIGLRLIKDEETVKSMSRSGNPAELLRGPLMYGVVFAASTCYFWVSPKSIMALMLLCVGDGFAGLIGQTYGKSSLPWNRRKSWEGTISFVVMAFLFSEIFIEMFHQWNWFTDSASSMFVPLLIATIVCAFVESLPFQNDWDNITVFVVGILVIELLT